MATYYARAGGGSWTAAATWSLTSGGGATGSTPTAADEVIFDANSGNVTINSGAVCRSWTVNGYTGTITHTAAITLTIGDATPGTGNVAINFATSGWTYTLGNALTSATALNSTSTTQQTVVTAGKTLGNFSVATTATGSNYLLGSSLTCGSITTNAGTWDTGNFAVNATTWNTGNGTRVLSLGSSTITLSGAFQTLNAVGLTISSNTADIIMTNATTGYNNFVILSNMNMNGASFTFTGGGQGAFNTGGTSAVVHNLTYTGAALKTGGLRFTTSLTITGTFSVNGNSVINRVLMSAVNTAAPITLAVGTLGTMSNVDFMDITAGGASAPWNLASITGDSGDCGGNSNITFTTPATQTAVGTGGIVWSLHTWSGSPGRVPLPQDDVIIANSFIPVQSIAEDMPRMGKNVTVTATGSPTWVQSSTGSIFGSWQLAPGMTTANANNIIFAGHGSHTITTNGVTLVNTPQVDCVTGTYTLQDSLTASTSFALISGTLDTNNQTVTTSTFVATGTVTRTLTLGSTTWNLTSATGTPWNTGAAGWTLNAGTSIINIASASASNRSFGSGNKAYNILQYTVPASTGGVNIAGSSSYGGIHVSGGSRTISFNSGGVYTVNSAAGWQVFGTAGNLVTVSSNAAGVAFTLAIPSGTVSSDYISLRDSTASGAVPFYAGANSTDVSGNTNWLFTAPPSTFMPQVIFMG